MKLKLCDFSFAFTLYFAFLQFFLLHVQIKQEQQQQKEEKLQTYMKKMYPTII